jgi:ADP-heptose:LPS heptosyltransferase
MKQRLLVLDLWGVGDLGVASPFLRLASEKYEVTLVAKPLAEELRPRFWPDVHVVPFTAPWTFFERKYRLHEWPWKSILQLLQTLRRKKFDAVVSARWDPRDHLLMALTGAKRRYGFARLGSQVFLTDPLNAGEQPTHRYAHWQQVAKALEFDLPTNCVVTKESNGQPIVIHTGASQPVKVWPLERYARLVHRLRGQGYSVRVLCDANQLEFWQEQGEAVVAPRSLTELCGLLDLASVFIGNDSGPGHLAAVSGTPTFTIFGNQGPAMFAPIHPASEWIEGASCRYKPCYDHCRFPVPNCLVDLDEEKVCRHIELFAAKRIRFKQSAERA